MKIRKKTLALLLFSVAFMCSVGVSAFVLWQTDALHLQPSQPVVSTAVGRVLYPAADAEGHWGYIDEQGAWQVQAQFEQACLFEGKAAWVKQNGLWGAIDSAGEFVVQPEYAEIELFEDGNNRFMAARGSVLSSQMVNTSLYDINGQKLFGLAGELKAPSSGLMAFSRDKGGKIRWGYINPHGEIIIEPNYAEVGQAAGNYALVKDEDDQTLLLNIYAKTGTVCAAADNLDAVGSRLVLVRGEAPGLYGYRDVDGNVQIDASFVKAEAFRGGAALAAVPASSGTSAPGELWGLLTPDGVWALGPEYRAGVYLGNGVYAMALCGQPGYHIVNSLGEKIVDTVVYCYDEWQQGLLACHTADSTRFVDINARQRAELALPLTPGAVWQDDMYGVMNAEGAIWYTAEGKKVFAGGRECLLGANDELQLGCELEAAAGYLVYYPQVTGADKLGNTWRRLNTALKEQAVDDYATEYADADEINFMVCGDYELTRCGNVMTVCQRLQLDDSWQMEGGATENVAHTVCFDAASGRMYRLGDLFVAGFGWRTELGGLLATSYDVQCAQAGEAAQEEVLELLNRRLSRNMDFVPEADGVWLYFTLLDGRVVKIELMWADVDEWINRDGNLWQGLALDDELEYVAGVADDAAVAMDKPRW